jgi:CRISPR/Cas system Type II protein with McrA/HNH and RuvC-like nuclease domain
MTILRRRDRIVVFRLSQDEYARLQTACSERGGASLSDFTRSELLAAIDGHIERNSGVPGWFSELHQELFEVRATLQQMTQVLAFLSERKR